MAISKDKQRSLINRLLNAFLRHSGFIGIVRHVNRAQIKILMYHSIAPKESYYVRGIGVTVKPTTFEEQLSYLRQHYRVIPLHQLILELRDGCVGEKTVVLTFDDGFRDSYEFAWPILHKYGVRATVFLNKDVIERGKILWIHRFTYLANCAGMEHLWKLASQRWPALAGVHSTRTGRFMVLMNYLVDQVLPVDRDTFLAEAFRSFEIADPAHRGSDLYLRWDQVHEMAADGIEFGNHTRSHENLARLSEREQQCEIVTARDIIAEMLPGSMIPFAYPFGGMRHFTNLTARIVRESGHSCALLGTGRINSHDTPVYALDRIKVEEEPLSQFAARIEGLSLRRWLRNVRSRKQCCTVTSRSKS